MFGISTLLQGSLGSDIPVTIGEFALFTALPVLLNAQMAHIASRGRLLFGGSGGHVGHAFELEAVHVAYRHFLNRGSANSKGVQRRETRRDINATS